MKFKLDILLIDVISFKLRFVYFFETPGMKRTARRLKELFPTFISSEL